MHYKIEMIVFDELECTDTDDLADAAAQFVGSMNLDLIGEVAVYEVTHYG